MARRRRRPLFHIGVLLVVAACVVALVDVLGRLNLLERAVGGLVAQAGARKLGAAITGSRWTLLLLALGLACLGLAALGASRRSLRRLRRAARPRPARRRPARPRRGR